MEFASLEGRKEGEYIDNNFAEIFAIQGTFFFGTGPFGRA